MEKVWKKVLFFAVVLLVAPTMFLFVGCGSSTAKFVQNRTFYATKVLCNLESDEATLNGNPKIYFFNDHFRFEFGSDDAQGYYVGDYKIDRNVINLEITGQGGMFQESIPSKLLIKKLYYSNKKLTIEFFEEQTNNGYQYVFEAK